jgi:hypothetical protein
MIITVAKPLSEILHNLERHRSVFVVGCAACATKCQTGGDEAVQCMIDALRAAGKDVRGHIVLDTPCDMRIVKRDLGRSAEAAAAEALVILACGAGVQAIEKICGTQPLYPALNPVFIGTTERIGVYHGFCGACGDCLLDRTGGICPLTRCSKGLANGPCGGAVGGKCEADTTRECAWGLIFEKLKKLGDGKTILQDRIAPRSHARPHILQRPAAGRDRGNS